LCKILISSAEKIAEDERSDNTIFNALEHDCAKLPLLLQSSCKLLIKTLIPELNKLDPDTVCEKSGFCSAEDIREERHMTTDSADSIINCTACEFSVKSLQKMAPQMTTRDSPLKPICNVLPDIPGMVCNAVDAIIDSNNKRRDFPTARPRDICRDVDMCPLRAVRSAPSLDIACEGCLLFVSAFGARFQSNSTKQAYTSELQKVCTKIQSEKGQDECITLMNTFAPLVMEYIGGRLTNKDACIGVGICLVESPK
jgi:hypothetical protein